MKTTQSVPGRPAVPVPGAGKHEGSHHKDRISKALEQTKGYHVPPAPPQPPEETTGDQNPDALEESDTEPEEPRGNLP